MKRPLLALFVLLFACISLPQLFRSQTDISTGSDPELITFSGRTMGTTYHITLACTDTAEIQPDQLHQAVDLRLQLINQFMSTYIPDSEISRINKAKALMPVAISPETAWVLGAAQEVSNKTKGAFDITVGNLVNLWGFGPDINIYAIPDAAKIKEALAQSGYKNLTLESDPPRVSKHIDTLYLDLSGIAKGYAVDEIAAVLVEAGYPNHLVEIGGEIRTGGRKGAETPWSIGIERPQTDGRSIQKIIHTSTTTSMATSGDYRNYFEHAGRRYSHTIDPATGYPITHKLAAVSVLHTSCMLADAYATAFMVMGAERTMKFAQKHSIAVYMLVKGERGFVPISSPAFEKFISSPGGR